MLLFDVLFGKFLCMDLPEVNTDESEFATPKLCDEVLRVFYDYMWKMIRPNDETIISEIYRRTGIKHSKQVMFAVLMILKNEEFAIVKEGIVEVDSKDISVLLWSIGDKGLAFINTDTFVDRKARWDLEKKTNMLEYSLKKRTFGIAVAALVISILTFLKSSCNDKSDDNISNHPPPYNKSSISNSVIK